MSRLSLIFGGGHDSQAIADEILIKAAGRSKIIVTRH
jgi:hypothetical protein